MSHNSDINPKCFSKPVLSALLFLLLQKYRLVASNILGTYSKRLEGHLKKVLAFSGV